MLMTQRQMLNAQNLRFPNPERISKVEIETDHVLFSNCKYKFNLLSLLCWICFLLLLQLCNLSPDNGSPFTTFLVI